MSHEHYFRDVSGLEQIDVYRLLELFGVTCPVAQHVVKKAIAAGQRGHKSIIADWQDIADSAARKLQMIDEDLRAIDRACGVEGGVQGLQDHPIGVRADGIEPAVIENAAFFNSNWQEVAEAARMVSEMAADWPDESRRQDGEAEEEAWRSVEARMDVIGQNGNDGEHYESACAAPPSWIDAPQWANWVAQDKNGEWWFFENEPTAIELGVTWIEPSIDGQVALAMRSARNGSWRETLQARP